MEVYTGPSNGFPIRLSNGQFVADFLNSAKAI